MSRRTDQIGFSQRLRLESLVAASSRLDLFRHGLDDDLVMLQKQMTKGGVPCMTLYQRASQATLPSVESERQPTFMSFPEFKLLEADKVPITEIAELALREGQCTDPICRVHRIITTWDAAGGVPARENLTATGEKFQTTDGKTQKEVPHEVSDL